MKLLFLPPKGEEEKMHEHLTMELSYQSSTIVRSEECKGVLVDTHIFQFLEDLPNSII